MKNEDRVLVPMAHLAVECGEMEPPSINTEPNPIAWVESRAEEPIKLWRSVAEIEIEDRATGETETHRVVTVYAVGENSGEIDFLFDRTERTG